MGATVRTATIILLAAVLPASAGAGVLQRQEDDPLRVLTRFHPLRVEGAHPAVPGLQAGIALGSADQILSDGVLLRPEVLLGLPIGLQLGVALNFSLTGEPQAAGPIEVHALGLLVEDRGLVPAVAVRTSVFTPGFDAGAGGELAGILTKAFGENRVHLNLAFRAQSEVANRLFVGLAADRQLARWLLLAADVWFDNPLGEAGVLGLSVGANTRITRTLLLQAGAGFTRRGTDFDPRLILALRQLF